MTWDYAIKEFIKKQSVIRGHSKLTVEAYARNLRMLFGHMLNENINDPTMVTREDIEAYFYSLNQASLSNASINQKISTFRQFYLDLCLLTNTLNPMSNINSVKNLQHLPNFLTIDEVKLFLALDCDSDEKYLHKAIFEVLYCGGLRVSELCNLQMGNLHLNQNLLRFMGKGSKERIVVIHKQGVDCLNYYLNNVRNKFIKRKDNRLVFINKQGLGITRQYVYTIVKKRAIECNLNKNISPHSLRHSFASHMLGEGSNLIVIQELLGHSDIKTTQIYTHINEKQLHENYDNYFPFANRKNKVVKNNE